MSDQPLIRTADFTVVRASDGDDGLTLEGYAAVFNTATRIDSWEGKFDEVIAPGAFKRTIDHKGPAKIRLQFDHGKHPTIGSIPIGAITELREDARGLFVRARLFDNDLVKPVRDAIRGGAITGMSFQFRVVRDDVDNTGDVPLRTIREVELFELGPVVWPAYDTTTVGVRADDDFRRHQPTVGTSDEPAAAGTSDEPAADDDTPDGTRRDRSDAWAAARTSISEFLATRERKETL
jgi:uncharacterized protein